MMKQRNVRLCVLALISAALAAASIAKADVLDDKLAEIKKSGDPIDVTDFVVKGVAEKDNAVVELRLAQKSLDDNSTAWQGLDNLNDVAPPLTEAEANAIEAAVRMNPKVFSHIDRALGRSGVDWQIPFASPLMMTMLYDLNPLGAITYLVRHRALLEHQSGDDAAALANVQRMLFISQTVWKMPFGVAHLRGNGMMQSASQTIALLAPDLHNGAGEREASAKAIAALIAQLLDDAPQRAGTKLALQIERTNEADKARQLSGNGIDLRKVPGHAKDPVLRADRDKAASDAVATIDYTTAMLGILQTSPDWPAAQAKFRPLAAGLHAVQPQNALIDTLLGLEKVAHDDYHTTTERRLAATALAIRWYASDHDGKRPGALKDLVPKYLPDVPLDPMADAKPLQYKNDDQHAIIYSAGDDGRDDGGADRAGPAPKKNLTGWQAFDYVVHLDRQPRQTTPQK